eukprot:GHRQ01024888.1.p1 GENE.GHRQ01024888.1~~GHRQ01024888.1.p1  ORF type:complete len:112 (+),score=20.78 GHRQ01024888.1:236-571(+)
MPQRDATNKASSNKRVVQQLTVALHRTRAVEHHATAHTPAAATCRVVAADADKANAVLPIGGPGKALTAKEQAEILFRCAAGRAAQGLGRQHGCCLLPATRCRVCGGGWRQ